MANPYQSALDNLRKYSAGIYREDPNSALLSPDDLAPRAGLMRGSTRPPDPGMLRRTQLKNLGKEYETRSFNAQRGGDKGEYEALKSLMAGNEQELANDPTSQEIAQTQLQDKQARDLEFEAREAGFSTPQEYSQYKQKLERDKINSPRDVADLDNRGRLLVAKEQGRNLLENQRLIQSGKGSLSDMFEKLAASGGDRNRPRSISMSGVGSASFDPAPPDPATSAAWDARLAAAQKAFDASKTGWRTFSGNADLKANLDRVKSLMRMGGASPAEAGAVPDGANDIEETARDIMVDGMNMPWNDIQMKLVDPQTGAPEFTASELAQLQAALRQLGWRGR